MDFEIHAKPVSATDKLGMAAFYLGAGALVYALDVGLPTNLGDPWIYAYLVGWPVVVMLLLLKVVVLVVLAVVCFVVISHFEDRRVGMRFARNGRGSHPAG